MSKPKVSVIMGVYNCANLLPDAIESILNQTYKDWELIICDDASTDNTYNVAAEYQKKHQNKIKLIRNERNSKLSYSLNQCLKYATGEYIARMDGDDISKPERFEEQVKFLDDHPEIHVVGSWMTPFDENGEQKPHKYKEYPCIKDLIKGVPFAHATIMMRKSAYDAVGGYKVSKMTARSEDYDMWFRFYACGFIGYNLQKSLYLVREDLNAFSRRKFRVYWNAVKLRWCGFRTVRFPIRYYIFVLKPIGGYLINLFRYLKIKRKNRKPEC